MKFVAVLLATLSLASAFAPATKLVRPSTELNALFDAINNMDLFDREKSKYGNRDKKTKQGSLGSNSYVPAGLTAAQYANIRAADAKKTSSNYQKNAAKAGKFGKLDSFYLARGTDEGGKWLKAPAKGHSMVKTKYDFSGSGKPNMADAKLPEAFKGSIFGGK